MNGQLTPAFPIETAQLLHDITGETEPTRALYQTLRDAVEHRLEKISILIEKLEKKYRLTFNQFKKQWLAGKINKKYGYPVEKDYWEWEGLTSRYQKLKISLNGSLNRRRICSPRLSVRQTSSCHQGSRC